MIDIQKIKKYLLNGKDFSFSKDYKYTYYDKKIRISKMEILIYYQNKFLLEISSYENEVVKKNPSLTSNSPKSHTLLTFDEVSDLMFYLSKNTMFNQSDFPAEFTTLRQKAGVENIKAKLNISRIKGNLTNSKGLSLHKKSSFNNEETAFSIGLTLYEHKYVVNITENFNSIDEGLLEDDIGYVRNEQKSFDNFEDAFDYILSSTDITENDFPHKFRQKEITK